MTEAEWLSQNDPADMLNFLSEEASGRKLRLFGVACVDRQIHTGQGNVFASLVRIAEQFADGRLTDIEVASVVESVADTEHSTSIAWACRHLCLTDHAGSFVAAASSIYAADAASEASGEEFNSRLHLRQTPTWCGERHNQSQLLKDIFGNPFRPVAVDSAWLTETVVALAEGIYQERAFDRMPILADALEDAGCDNADVLNHCRQPGEHVRGCWVVDLLTGRT